MTFEENIKYGFGALLATIFVVLLGLEALTFFSEHPIILAFVLVLVSAYCFKHGFYLIRKDWRSPHHEHADTD